MTGRLVVVSNRIPAGSEPAGGLMVALHPTLKQSGGMWIGSAPDPVEVPSKALTEIGSDPYRRLTFDITPEEHETFYLGYCNAVLWPLFHRRADLMAYDARFAEAYSTVNARVARLMLHDLSPQDRIWIHDYHFLPLAAELRALGVRNPIGFFLHTPFPVRDDLQALPQHRRVLDWLAAYDLVGLQTERDVAACLEVFRADPETEVMQNGRLRRSSGEMAVASFPIGIDVEDFAQKARDNADRDPLSLAAGHKLVIGVDRLDYSKGLVERFKGFEAYLAQRDAGDPRATFLQIAQLSRSDVGAYQDMRNSLETITGRINGRYGATDWTPIRYISRGLPRDRVAGLMRRANTCLVTPLADGMNLVVKEFVAAQDPDDPGIPILSHFAGAAEQMDAALHVTPYDTDEVAGAIRIALEMPLDERRDRHAELLNTVKSGDVSWWSNAYLSRFADAAEDRLRSLGNVLHGVV